MNPGHRAGGWRRHVRAAMSEHLLLKATALFFALVLWLVVSAEEPVEEAVAVRLVPALDSGVVVEGELPVVRALVLGRGRELLKLYRAPPVIHRRVRAGQRDSVRLELGPGDVDLPVGVTAVVRDVRPRVVILHLRRRTPALPSNTEIGVEASP